MTPERSKQHSNNNEHAQALDLEDMVPVDIGLAQKLHPSRFTNMSGKMAAIVGYVVGETFTAPAFSEMAITSDGFVLAGIEGDVGLNEFLGSVSDLERNLDALAEAAELTPSEKENLDLLVARRMRDWRRAT